MTNLIKLIVLSLFAFGIVLAPRMASADDTSDAKAFITKQVEQIKKGDVAGLKAGFTPRLQDKITDANVKKGADQVGKMSIDELVSSVISSKDQMKIKMKNGRTLTTLVKTDGKWFADTVWFK